MAYTSSEATVWRIKFSSNRYKDQMVCCLRINAVLIFSLTPTHTHTPRPYQVRTKRWLTEDKMCLSFRQDHLSPGVQAHLNDDMTRQCIYGIVWFWRRRMDACERPTWCWYVHKEMCNRPSQCDLSASDWCEITEWKNKRCYLQSRSKASMKDGTQIHNSHVWG